MRQVGCLTLSVLLFAASGCRSAPGTGTDMPDAAMGFIVPAWSKGLAEASTLYPTRRGYSDVRGIIHLHSVRSWDACDQMPLPGGAIAKSCFDDLRAALCTNREDYAMLTDHHATMADTAWDDLFIPVQGDELVMKGENHVGSRIVCPGGHKVLVQVGGENEIMPLGLEGHVAADAAMRHSIMTGSDAASVSAFRNQNAVIAFAHTESKTMDELHAVVPDAVEVYNIHANIDPKIRTLMGLDPTAPISHLAPFLSTDDTTLEADMAFLAIFEELPAELTKYQQLLFEGRHLTGTAGSDAHQNAIAIKLADGERGDSYRRMLRWFSNHLLVPAGTTVTTDDIKSAIKTGRGYVLFEVFGPAMGFDFHAEAGGGVAEMGETVMLASQPLLLVAPPVLALSPGQEAPAIKVRLLQVTGTGAAEVASSDGSAPIRFLPTKPGAYRAEVRITPNHLRGYMGTAQKLLLRDFVWIYANAIYVN